MDKERMLLMYEYEIKTMREDLKVVKSAMSEEVIKKELEALISQYEFSKKSN